MFDFIRHVVRGFLLVILCALLVPTTFAVVVFISLVFMPLPANLPTAAAAIGPSLSTHIYDIDGNEIDELHKFEISIPVSKSDIPDVLEQAIVASEDKNFYKHHGVDATGIARAFWQNLKNERTVQGGSTITQQYIKLAYTKGERTVARKAREAVLASQIDRQIPKDEIIYRYLSMVYLGDGAYGIGAASELYFKKPVKDLTISEAALLVGVLPAPSARAPRENPEICEEYRKLSLKKMLEQHYITQEQYETEIAKPIWLEDQGAPSGSVTMVYERVKSEKKYPYFSGYVEQYLRIKYGDNLTYRGGLKVQTTLDQKMQAQAQSAVSDALKGTAAPLDMALASVEPQTGFVKAMVGGRDYSSLKVNLALGACPATPVVSGKKQIEQVVPSCRDTKVPASGGSGRQPGSSFKAFVLASAYEVGFTPNSTFNSPSYWSIPDCIGKNCTIGNYEGEVGGTVTLKEATADSLNTVYAPLIREIGIKKSGHVVDGFMHTAELAKRLGVTSAYYSKAFNSESGTYALGTIEVAPLDMASAYGVFANRGLKQTTTPVVKIVDSSGKVIEDNTSRSPERVLSEPVADNVTDTLRAVVEHGTASRNGQIGRQAAGKTGTAEKYTNAWFVGYTPALSTAVWMGNTKEMKTINYKGNTRVAGGTVPTQVWAQYMKAALENVPATDFSEPAPLSVIKTDVLKSNAPTVPATVGPKVIRKPSSTPQGDFEQTKDLVPSVSPPETSVPDTTNPLSDPNGGGSGLYTIN